MLTCVVCMRACMACGAREKESKRGRAWSNPLKRARRLSSTLGRYRLPLLLSSLALSRSASRHADASIPEALLLHALSLAYARLTLSPPRHGWLHGVFTVLTHATHTQASEDCVCSLGRVCRRRRCLHATYSRKSVAEMPLDAILTTHSLVWR